MNKKFKIANNISIALIFIGFLMMLGTAGLADTDENVSLMRLFIQSVISVVVLYSGVKFNIYLERLQRLCSKL